MERLLNIFNTTTYTSKQLITAGLIASCSLLALSLGKKYFNGGVCKVTRDLPGKVVVITGANTGIGKETARELARLGAKVILACRDAKRTLPVVEELKVDTKNENIEFMQLDLGDLESIRKFTETFKAKYNRLDVLVNNAGIMALQERTLTKDGFEAQFGTNHIGHFYLTKLLLDVIKASGPSRIINVSSRAQRRVKAIHWDDIMLTKNYAPFTAYDQSKLANVMFSRELQRRMDLEKADVKVVSLHPGTVRTEIGRNLRKNPLYVILGIIVVPLFFYILKSAKQGAQTSLHCALEEQRKIVGGAYYFDCEVKDPNLLALDDESCKRLWDMTEKLLEGKVKKLA